jgi:hypothetical protein
MPGLPEQVGNIIVGLLVLLLTYAFASFVSRVVEMVHAQAVWFHGAPRIAGLLQVDGWVHAPEAGEDGYTRSKRRGVHLEPALLARADDGTIWTPLREGRAAWPDQAFGDVAELLAVRARVMNRQALIADKCEPRADPTVAAKDRADVEVLTRSSHHCCAPAGQAPRSSCLRSMLTATGVR